LSGARVTSHEVPISAFDLERLPARAAGLVWGIALGIVFGSPLGFLLGARGVPLVVFVLASIVLGVFTIVRITTGIPEGAAQALMRFVFPSGYSTPYEPTYSNEQALAARGEHAAALAAYDEAMRLRPTDPEPRFQAAELLLGSATPERAAKYLGQARRLSTNNPARELYATQRLIDLYWGRLRDHPRARAELRRLIQRFPGTREAAAAAELLEALSAEVPRV
jgi:thioredoxin-like negative regulator of GroEL